MAKTIYLHYLDMEAKAIHAMIMSVLPFTIQSCSPVKIPVIAHRGASFLAAENTLSAVKLAWEIGVDAVEIDVRMTQDEKIVLMHDANTKRTAGRNLIVSEALSQDLDQLRVGRPWNRASRVEPIPYLEDVLETVPKNRKLFIEVKTGPEIVKPLSRLLNHYESKDRLVIIGFDFETISRLKNEMRWLTVYWLLGPKLRKPLRKNPDHYIQMAKESGIDGLNVHASLGDKSLQSLTQSAGLKFLVWVVNHAKTATHLSNRGVDGITTDRPEIFIPRDSQ